MPVVVMYGEILNWHIIEHAQYTTVETIVLYVYSLYFAWVHQKHRLYCCDHTAVFACSSSVSLSEKRAIIMFATIVVVSCRY